MERVGVLWDLEGLVLRPWQQAVLRSKDAPEPFDVDVVVDMAGKGNLGKTTLVRFLVANGLATLLPCWLPPSKALRSVTPTTNTELFVVDKPRARKLTSAFWAMLSELRSGMFVQPRPRVWVLTTEIPTLKVLSRHRVRLWHVDESTWELCAGCPGKPHLGDLGGVVVPEEHPARSEQKKEEEK